MTRPILLSLSARVFACALLALLASSATAAGQTATHRAFAAPEDAVKALFDAVKAGNLDALLAIFGPEGRELSASSDPGTARLNREVFTVAAREQWRLEDVTPTQKTLVVGNEDWPFPVPLVKGRRRMAIRHSRRQGRSAGAADRAQRDERDREQPCLRHRTAALRARGTRRQARRSARDEVPERSRQTERPVLADRARRRSGVQLVTCWHRQRRKDVSSTRIARSPRPFMVTISRS